MVMLRGALLIQILMMHVMLMVLLLGLLSCPDLMLLVILGLVML